MTDIHRVFVFPSCNEIGLEIIHGLLKSNKFEVLGGSSTAIEFDPSRLLLKEYVECPWYATEDFEERFKELMREHRVDLLFPAWDKVVALFSDWTMEGLRVVAPRPEIARLLLSKSQTYDRLSQVVPTPKRYAVGDSFPLFAKPDEGSGSMGALRVENDRELAVAQAKGLLIAEYLPGDEYTVDCFSDLNGELLCAQVRLRAVIGRGIALGTRSVEHEEIERYCRAIAEALRIEGPWLAQFRENKEGKAVLLEVNARVAGSMGHTRHAGINIPLLAAFMFTGHAVRAPRIEPGLVVSRSLNISVDTPPFSWVIWDLDDTLLRKDGRCDPDAMACLFDCNNRGIRQLLLSVNPRAREIVAEKMIPNVFVEIVQTDDKVSAMRDLFTRHAITQEECIMVNDSYSELFTLQDQYPALRIVTPDALSRLGRERLH